MRKKCKKEQQKLSYLTHRFLQLRWSLHLRCSIPFITAKENRLCNLRHKKKLKKNVNDWSIRLKKKTRANDEYGDYHCRSMQMCAGKVLALI